MNSESTFDVIDKFEGFVGLLRYKITKKSQFSLEIFFLLFLFGFSLPAQKMLATVSALIGRFNLRLFPTLNSPKDKKPILKVARSSIFRVGQHGDGGHLYL